MPEYMVKRYVSHYALVQTTEDIDVKIQEDLNELSTENWTVDSMVATNDVGDARTVVVTFKKDS